MELRCVSRILHGVILEDGSIEVKCKSARCGHAPGVVVLHRFNAATGEFSTEKFNDPRRVKNAARSSISVRSA